MPRSITLKKLDGSSNIEALASGIIDRCDLIHPSRLPTVMGLLSDMQVRIVEEENKITSAEVCISSNVHWPPTRVPQSPFVRIRR